MWLFAMFDLPVITKDERRRYTRFRNFLIKEGFEMMQFSVYARYCPSEQTGLAHKKRIKKALPNDGHVRVLMITDKQFGKMEVYYGKRPQKIEQPPDQLVLL